ncbi:MAG: Uma2 family endonuclease [Gemmataceae bacterium]
MNMRIDQPVLDPEELALSGEGSSYEFVHGKPVEKPMGAESDALALAFGAQLFDFVRRHGLGKVGGSQTGYRCFPHDSRLVRKPDVSFVAAARVPGGKVPKGDYRIAPDLAVEFISPNELFEEVEEKLTDYHAAGVRLVWVVSPGSKTVQVRRADGSCAVLREADTLSGEDVVPGFACKVADLFV